MALAVGPGDTRYRRFIRDKLARFKQPKAAVVVESLPRNTMGKVQKNVLRDTYKGWFQA